jgi:hypothetical protein
MPTLLREVIAVQNLRRNTHRPGHRTVDVVRHSRPTIYGADMPMQMRRYQIDPTLVDEWLEFFERLTVVRAEFGFRLRAAYLDRTNSEFTWFVEHDQPFAEVEPNYVASPERAAVFAGQPSFALALHVSEVDTIH